MYMFVFVLTFVINFSLYKAGLQNYENQGFEENSSPIPIDSVNSGPKNGNQNRNTRESIFTRVFDGENDIINIGNGYNKHNVIIVEERPRDSSAGSFPNTDANTRRKPNIGSIGNQPPANSYGRYPNPQRESNLDDRFADVPEGVDSYQPRTATKTGQSIYTKPSEGHKDIINIGKGDNKNIVIIEDEKPRGNSADSFPNTGRRLNNFDVRSTRNQPPTKPFGKYPNPQGESNLGNRFGSDVPQGVDNSDPSSTIRTGESIYTRSFDGQNDIINIGNGDNKHNVFIVNERSRSNSAGSFPNKNINTGRRPNNVNVGSTRNQLPTYYHERNPNTQESNLGNRFGNDAPEGFDESYPRTYNSQNTRRVKNYINNIGNGVGNRNTFFIEDNSSGEERTATVLSPSYENNRRPKNTQQNNFRTNTYSWNTNIPRKFNQGDNNEPTDIYTYSRIGHGPDNSNVVIINGKRIRLDSNLSIMTREHQGRGEQNNFNRNVENNKSEDRLRVIPLNYRSY